MLAMEGIRRSPAEQVLYRRHRWLAEEAWPSTDSPRRNERPEERMAFGHVRAGDSTSALRLKSTVAEQTTVEYADGSDPE